MKVFARTKIIHDEHAGRVPFNQNIALAIEGFHQMGFEVYFYEKIEEIYDIYELGDIVLDGITQVEYCLQKFGINFPNIDYPDILKEFLGRKIWYDTINNVNQNPKLWGNFVKPTKAKVFTGKIFKGPQDLMGCGSNSENYEVMISEPLNFVYEVRGLVYYDKLVDLRPYNGDWHYMSKLDTNIIDAVMKKWILWEERPKACTLDFGVVKSNETKSTIFVPNAKSKYNKNNNLLNLNVPTYKTVLVEANAGCSFGPYSTNALNYAKIISATFAQISNVKDECYFGPIL